MRAHPTPHSSRAGRRLAGAALTVAVTGITTTTVFAADAGNIEVDPSPARAGATVTLSTIACGPGGSAGVDASSLGVGILGLDPQDAESGTAQGTLRIPADTKPGNYAVGGSCTDGQELTGTIVVGDKQRMAQEEGKEHQEEDAPAKEQSTAGKGEQGADGAAPHQPHDPAGDRDMHQGKGEAPGHEAPRHEAPDHKAPDHHAQAPHHEGQPGEGQPHDRDEGHDRGKGHHAVDPRADRHGAMPHGRVHTGVGGATDGMSTAQLAGGSAALAAAAGSVLYLRRRSRTSGY